jgi:hypothetical protein
MITNDPVKTHKANMKLLLAAIKKVEQAKSLAYHGGLEITLSADAIIRDLETQYKWEHDQLDKLLQ